MAIMQHALTCRIADRHFDRSSIDNASAVRIVGFGEGACNANLFRSLGMGQGTLSFSKNTQTRIKL